MNTDFWAKYFTEYWFKRCPIETLLYWHLVDQFWLLALLSSCWAQCERAASTIFKVSLGQQSNPQLPWHKGDTLPTEPLQQSDNNLISFIFPRNQAWRFPQETIFMKCQSVFSGIKIRKKNIINLVCQFCPESTISNYFYRHWTERAELLEIYRLSPFVTITFL